MVWYTVCDSAWSVFTLGLVSVSLLWLTVQGKALRSLCESGGTQRQIAFGCRTVLFNAPSLVSFFVFLCLFSFNGHVPLELSQRDEPKWGSGRMSDLLMYRRLDHLSQAMGWGKKSGKGERSATWLPPVALPLSFVTVTSCYEDQRPGAGPQRIRKWYPGHPVRTQRSLQGPVRSLPFDFCSAVKQMSSPAVVRWCLPLFS